MTRAILLLRRAALPAAAIVLLAGAAAAQEIRVMTSGAFTGAYNDLVPECESPTRTKVATYFGAALGNAPDSIPSRVQRGEPVDVVILAAEALEELIRQGKVAAGSRVDLVRSGIGIAVRSGTPKPDVSTVEGLKRTLL